MHLRLALMAVVISGLASGQLIIRAGGGGGGLTAIQNNAGTIVVSSPTILRMQTSDAIGWTITDLGNNIAGLQPTANPVTLATGTSHTFAGNSDVYVCSSTCTITVPVPAQGLQYCAFNGDNVSTVITMSAIGSSARYENTARTAYGTAGTGTFVSGGAVKDFACLLGLDSTHYLTVSSNGTWTAN